jgi:hypothetical protein
VSRLDYSPRMSRKKKGTHCEEAVPVWRARAGDLDGFTSCVLDGSIAVPSASRVQTRLMTELGDEGGVHTTGCRSLRCRRRGGGGSGRRGAFSPFLNSLLLGQERCRSCGASDARPSKVLQGDDRRLHTSELRCLGVVRREGNGDARVVHDLACCDVRVD